MNGDYTQARLQRIEERVASLDDTVSILAVVDDSAAKNRMAEMFYDDPSMAIIYIGVEKGITQTNTAEALHARKLPRADQGEVSRARAMLADKNFITKTAAGYDVRPGWKQFGIDKYLRQILKRAGIANLA
jgi:hypothetical protein